MVPASPIQRSTSEYVRPVIIRDAAPDDWPRFWPTFQAIVEAGETYAYPVDLTLETGRPWWMEQPPGRTVMAVAGEALLGSAKMGPNRPGRGAHVATASFMVDPSCRRSGVGRALALHVIEWARAAGYRGMQFNAVVETNGAAVRLWQSLGFEIVGTVPEAFDHATCGLVGLHVMFLRL
jgi:GNAT superfamily N-acetyltransferase